ncbi:hypothetical protein OPIT5_03310 [Opitutaceae bacterium TAV5]|nr:hypothetical protein OPIT5_03310 [Opitutaceae bacterium TAV5]
MSATTSDKVLLGVAGLLFLGASAWAWFQETDLGDAAVVNAPTSGKNYEPEEIVTLDIETQAWPDPKPLSRGEEWLFDVFTPPVIYYDANTTQFTVTPPIPPEEVKPVIFGLELLAVERDDFRLQLTGFIGSGDSARGTFEDVQNQDVIIGAVGKKIPHLNLEVTKFSVARQRKVPPDGGTPIIVTAAFATVRDTQTGEETELVSTERTKLPVSTATFRITSSGEVKKAKSGDSIVADDTTWAIERVTDTPPSATVTRRKAGEEADAETKVLEATGASPATSTNESAPGPAPEAPTSNNDQPAPPAGAFPGF